MWNSRNIIGIGLFVGFFGVVAIIIVFFEYALKEWVRRNWSTTQGKVISPELGFRRSVNLGGGDTFEAYEARIRYEYMVGGQSYIGIYTYFDRFLGTDRKKARKYLEDYPEGSMVSIQYNPNNPDLSALESKSQLARNTFLIGVSLLVIALLIILLGWMAA